MALVMRLDKLKVSVDGDNVCDHACTAMMGIAAEPSNDNQWASESVHLKIILHSIGRGK